MDELRRNLAQLSIDLNAIEGLLDQMSLAFPDAEVNGYQELVDRMTCDAKDRHVLAAAVRADAGAIVTFNGKDFPDRSVAPSRS
ncbi:MAG TPA: hypothetical protein VIR30_13470 [Nocardioides sp.]